ncbi:MAG: hypothetical protein HY420_02080 [Candidatus Kerfeldbacteria bacterium]|nr:hypothetical protein [Candidatus Kerfeldbacteria bacterium]
MKTVHKVSLIVVVLAIIGGGLWWWLGGSGGVPTRVFAADQTLEGNFVVTQGTKVVVQNGATLTVNGDLLVQGSLVCDGGPLNLRVKGAVTVERHVQCDRPAALSSGDVGNGIMVVAKTFNITKDAAVVSNGHVQMVTDATKLATTQEKIDALYDEAGKYRGEKYHFGPLTPREEIPESAKGLPTSFVAPASSTQDNELGFLGRLFVSSANAQEPAADIEGNPVANTNKVGGTWIVGDPSAKPPFNLTIPTPPKDITKIILNFDFGGDDVEIADFELTGPDGRPGKDDLNQSCDAKGGRGENAMRLNVNAATITVNNFDLHLGNGGQGGGAETTKDCDPATATGGQGGEAGNFKMVASEGFSITGAFTIFPGQGGEGGTATAHGKKGDDGCDGLKGGDATATGGKGGDNKKLLVVSGTVAGTSNIDIREMVGGQGGLGQALGGNGGDGIGSECNGGDGGKATATGGKGGDTNCSKFPCTGGKGGDAIARPGKGGNGGTGSATEAGGNGGQGGDANSTAGKGGTGKTANGEDGTVQDQTGGDGGNGGDGCGPGSGGAGGAGDPEGKKGEDGKNLCPSQQNVNTQIQPTNENTNTQTTPEPKITVPGPMSVEHRIGPTPCPTPIGTIKLEGENIPEGATLEVDPNDKAPAWLSYTLGKGTDSNVSFTCQLEQYVTQTLTHNLEVAVYDKDGKVIKTFTVPVTVNVKK